VHLPGEIFGLVVSVTTSKDRDEAHALANNTLYGLGAGVWSRDANTCYRMGRAIQAGRVRTTALTCGWRNHLSSFH